jgi:hypothetical protein
LILYYEAAADGRAGEAVEFGKRAAEEAMAVFAYEEAARHLERTLSLVGRGRGADEAERCEVLLRLGQARWGFDLQRSKEALLEAADLAERLGDGARLARAAIAMGGPFGVPSDSGASDDQQVRLLERALAVLGNEDSPLRATALARLALGFQFSAVESDERIAEVAREAVDTARRSGNDPTLAQVLSWTRAATWGPDEPLAFLASCRESAELATRLGDDRGDSSSFEEVFGEPLVTPKRRR